MTRSVSARPVLLAPLVFVLHVAEEAPGFVAWVNGIVRDGLTLRTFVAVNATAGLVTLALVALAASLRERAAALALLAWLSFLMLANGLLHVVGSAVYGYSPGTLTAVALYWPYFGWYAGWVRRAFDPPWASLLAAIAVGALPMLLQGYFVLFQGRRVLW